MDAGWAGAVAHRIHQSHPIQHRSLRDGRICVSLECTTCPKREELIIPKRLPPEAIARKMNRIGWDIKKRRCPSCKTSGRRTRGTGRSPTTGAAAERDPTSLWWSSI